MQQQLEQQLDIKNRQDASQRAQLAALNSKLEATQGKKIVPLHEIDRVAQEIQQLQSREADANADTTNAWHSVPRDKAAPELTALSNQLASEAVLREGWATLCKDLFSTFAVPLRESGVLAVGTDAGLLKSPSSPSDRVGVELLQRTIKVLDDGTPGEPANLLE